jgi:hypothetical protein
VLDRNVGDGEWEISGPNGDGTRLERTWLGRDAKLVGFQQPFLHPAKHWTADEGSRGAVALPQMSFSA